MGELKTKSASTTCMMLLGMMSLGAGGCVGESGRSASTAAIVDGARDLAASPDGSFQDTPSQWHRDATVQIEPGQCTGVLVAPNVVLTAAHCVRTTPTAVRFGPLADLPTPTDPDALVPVPVGVPSSYDASVIACIAHPTSGIACNDGFVGPPPTVGNDIAILVLDQRIDHGENGTRTQTYHAIPAEIVTADPACPFSSGVRSNVCWTGTETFHVGYGPTVGCVNPVDPTTFSRPTVRQARQQTVYIAQWVTGRESQFLLANLHGLPGDSGGPIFSMYEPFDDTRPLQVFGIYSGWYTPLATQVCAPGPVFGDLHDIGTRLTDNGVQLFLETVLGLVRGGELGVEVIDYPGITAPVTGVSAYRGGVWATRGIPAGFAVWTGDVDLPPATEPEARAAFGLSEGLNPDELDPDGDGLVGAHDNCWGYPNIEQRLSDATRICCMNDGGTTELASTFREACIEACPQPTTTVTPAIDCDSDLVPDVCEADDDRDSVPNDCDNCPVDANLDQADCNEDAILDVRERERLAGVPLASRTAIQGDVCDPEPCGETRIIEASSETSGAALFARDVSFDLLQVDARADVTRRARTGYRFCQCYNRTDTELSRRACSFAASDLLGGCLVNDLPRYDEANEHRPWRRMSLTPTAAEGTPSPAGAEDNLPYSTARVGSFEVNREGHWAVLTHDMPRWSTLDGVAESFVDFTTRDGFAGAIAGVVWTHTPGPAGGFFTEQERRRRSHYWSGELPRPYRTIPLIPRAVLFTPVVRGDDWHGRLAFIGQVPAFRDVAPGPMVMHSGFGVPRTTEMSLFEYGGTWVAASEPSSLLPDTGVRHVALDSNGAVALVLAEHEGTLLDADAPCPNQQCGIPSGQALLSSHGTSGPPPGALFERLPTSTSAVFVLSASRERLWRVSGATSSRSASLDTYNAATEQWAVRVVPDLGRVLAAVYSPREDVLWVLDEETSAESARRGERPRVRLLALGPDTGRTTIVARWPRHTLHDRFSLAVAPDGRLYLAASHHAAHVVALLDPSRDGVTFVGLRAGARALVPGMIRANADGVAVGVEGVLGQTVTTHSVRDVRGGGMSSCL